MQATGLLSQLVLARSPGPLLLPACNAFAVASLHTLNGSLTTTA